MNNALCLAGIILKNKNLPFLQYLRNPEFSLHLRSRNGLALAIIILLIKYLFSTIIRLHYNL